jgi:hypothetical protein
MMTERMTDMTSRFFDPQELKHLCLKHRDILNTPDSETIEKYFSFPFNLADDLAAYGFVPDFRLWKPPFPPTEE